VVEPVDPLKGRVFNVVDAFPRSLPTDQLGLVESDDRLGQSVVERVSLSRPARRRSGSRHLPSCRSQ